MEAVERQLLDRGAGAVWVEADLAKEDPVGPGDRALAHVDRVGAEEAVGEVAEAPADRLRAPARAASTSTQAMPRPGNSAARWGPPSPARRWIPSHPRSGRLGAHLNPSPRRGSLAEAHAHVRSSPPVVRSPMLALCSVPPGIGVGEGRAAADPIEPGDGAFAVIADRHLPAVLANQFADRPRSSPTSSERKLTRPR